MNCNDENTGLHAGYGQIQVILGPMFSGKTTELLRRIRRFSIAKKRCLVAKYKHDTRYDKSMMATHDKQMIQAEPVTQLSELTDMVKAYDVVGVDEGQFFPDLVDSCEKFANMGITVIVAALDGTYQRESFGQIPFLIAKAEGVTKLSAVCTECNRDAHFTHRFTDINEVEVIGGSEMYKPVCRACFIRANSPSPVAPPSRVVAVPPQVKPVIPRWQQPVLVSLEAPIAGGKSTLLRLLQQEPSLRVVQEPVDKWQDVNSSGLNVLQAFYENIPRYAYSFQNFAFVTRVREVEANIRQVMEDGEDVFVLVERSWMSDRHTFAKMLHEAGHMSELEWALYTEWYNWLVQKAPRFSGHIYLRSGVDTCMQRLQKRSRSAEATVSRDYMEQLVKKHDAFVLQREADGSEVLQLDGEKEFEQDPQRYDQLRSNIFDFLDKLRLRSQSSANPQSDSPHQATQLCTPLTSGTRQNAVLTTPQPLTKKQKMEAPVVSSDHNKENFEKFDDLPPESFRPEALRPCVMAHFD